MALEASCCPLCIIHQEVCMFTSTLEGFGWGVYDSTSNVQYMLGNSNVHVYTLNEPFGISMAHTH